MHAVDPRNVFVSIERQEGSYRVFIARGSDRRVSPASPDELPWIKREFPFVEKMVAAGEHKPEGV